MTQGLAITNEERKTLFESLTKAIEDSGLSVNEFIFSTSDLIKTTFWVSLTANLSEQETNELRSRISGVIGQIMDILDNGTNNIGEDMIVLSTVMLEAVNHVLAQELGEVSVDE